MSPFARCGRHAAKRFTACNRSAGKVRDWYNFIGKTPENYR